MSDPYIQREDERARDDEDDRRRLEIERRDRALEKASLDVPTAMHLTCNACGAMIRQEDVDELPRCRVCGSSEIFPLSTD